VIKILSALLLATILISCSGKRETSNVKVSVSSIAAAGVNMPGGMLLYGHNHFTKEKVSIKFKSGQDFIVLENGEWDLFIVGWNGSENMEGTAECGGTHANLNGEEVDVEFNISADRCLNPTVAESKFIKTNQFKALTINSCDPNPGAPSTSTFCTAMAGGVESVRVSLLTEYRNEKDVHIKEDLPGKCYNLAATSVDLSTVIPFGGEEHSDFKTKLEVFSDSNCGGIYRDEFIFIDGLSNPANMIKSDNASSMKFAIDASGLSIFIDTPRITDGAVVVVPSNTFTSVWRTIIPSEMVTLPLRATFNYNFTVDWGDGSPIASVTSAVDTDISHSYLSPGDYTVVITGLVEAWYFNNTGSKDNIIAVTDLGDMGWIKLGSAFYGCTNLGPFNGGVTTTVTDMSRMFKNAPLVTPDTSTWNTSLVTDMNSMFSGALAANPDTSSWDTANVQDMAAMFFSTDFANPDTSNWDTSSVTDMSSMFKTTSAASPDTSGWNTSSVGNMSLMFYSASLANPDTSGWNTSIVTNMENMFTYASNATPSVSAWDVSNVTSMTQMFRFSGFTSQDFSGWSPSNVTDMSGMFEGVSLTPSDYSSLIIAIFSSGPQSFVNLDAGSSLNDVNSVFAKYQLTDSFSWTFSDSGGPTPFVIDLSGGPTNGTSAGGTTITVNGGDFAPGILVEINGINCGSLSYMSEFQVTCITGASSPGVYNLTVTNVDGSSYMLSSAYTYNL
jgi:hypothetical protein